ncbi:MAG: integrase core domain-containing protein [Phycisphaerae bacterium]
MLILKALFWVIRVLLSSRTTLMTENLALRQQLLVLKRSIKRPNLRQSDRRFWVWLSCFWKDWKSVLLIVQPDTVVRWHRAGFRWYWKWKSKPGKGGRPKIGKDIRDLIRQISQENPLWGAPRIQAELHLLGHDVAESTVVKYMVKVRKPPSQTWRTFLENHMKQIVAIDFFTVPTIHFRILYCFIILRHDRRAMVHFNITPHPTAVWTAQQVANAFPEDTAPKYLIRDRDAIYGGYFRQRIKHMGINEVLISPQSPWQNPYAERIIGSIRRECLDHLIVWNERHLMQILEKYFEYYHHARAHQSLGGNSPIPRDIEPPAQGRVISIPMVGGLHHRYRRVA